MRFSSLVNWLYWDRHAAAESVRLVECRNTEMGHCLGLDHEDSVDPPPVMPYGRSPWGQ